MLDLANALRASVFWASSGHV